MFVDENVIMFILFELREREKCLVQLTRIVGAPLVEAVTQLKIDRFRWNHREDLLRQMAKLAPRLRVQLMVSIVQPQHLAYRVTSGFLDPETRENQ